MMGEQVSRLFRLYIKTCFMRRSPGAFRLQPMLSTGALKYARAPSATRPLRSVLIEQPRHCRQVQPNFYHRLNAHRQSSFEKKLQIGHVDDKAPQTPQKSLGGDAYRMIDDIVTHALSINLSSF
jgi:hypothetical protein